MFSEAMNFDFGKFCNFAKAETITEFLKLKAAKTKSIWRKIQAQKNLKIPHFLH